MSTFEYNKPVMAADPINASGKEKLKTYFNIKLNEMSRDIFNNIRFGDTSINKDSMKISLFNAIDDNVYHQYGDVKNISGLSVWDTGTGKYAVAVGLQLTFSCDPHDQSWINVLVKDFENKHKQVYDRIQWSELGSGEYLRTASDDIFDKDKVYFAVYAQILLDGEDID